MLLRIPILLAFLTLSFLSLAQERAEEEKPLRVKCNRDINPKLGMEAHFGFVAPHRDIMKHLVKGHSFGMSAFAEWRTLGNKNWHRAYARPSVGGEIAVYELGNPDQLGLGITALYYAALPLNKQAKVSGGIPAEGILPALKANRFTHKLRLGFGPGFLTRTYDLESNPKNFAAGSLINAGILMQYSAGFFTQRGSSVQMGLRIAHWSNAAFQLPNLGINLIALSAGYRWNSAGYEACTMPSREKNERKWINTTWGAFGVKEIFPPGFNKFLTYSLGHHLERDISNKVRLGLSTDLFFNTANRVLMARSGAESVNTGDLIQLGMAPSFSLVFDEFDILLVIGPYLRDRYKGNGDIYSRYGIRRTFGEHYTAVLMLKTHAAKADHFELGIGYRW